MRGRVRVLLVAVLITGCANGPILANPPAPRPSIPPPGQAPAPVADPVPVVLPRDDAPHDRLTEWWYYTGHLVGHQSDPGLVQDPYSLQGPRYGFEFVVFRAERGAFPTTWASHFALTDETEGRFHYAQRLEVGDAVDRSGQTTDGTSQGFDFELIGADPTRPSTLDRPPWKMAGWNGSDRLRVTLSPDEAAAAGVPSLSLGLTLSSRKPPALHDGDGWIDFGPGGGSYYYSRTDMAAEGVLTMGDATYGVEGTGWFDHQWGDFISVGGGGWDWFAVNLEDGTDLTLSLVRDADGTYPLIYGTLVARDGSTRHLERDEFQVTTTGSWTSPKTGAVYPSGWSIAIPGEGLAIDLTPTVADQELDTRATTGVVYWEGSQTVRATRDGRSVAGEAYVELTGYGPTVTPAPAP
jgi:predicted secreted hydrolase